MVKGYPLETGNIIDMGMSNAELESIISYIINSNKEFFILQASSSLADNSNHELEIEHPNSRTTIFLLLTINIRKMTDSFKIYGKDTHMFIDQTEKKAYKYQIAHKSLKFDNILKRIPDQRIKQLYYPLLNPSEIQKYRDGNNVSYNTSTSAIDCDGGFKIRNFTHESRQSLETESNNVDNCYLYLAIISKNQRHYRYAVSKSRIDYIKAALMTKEQVRIDVAKLLTKVSSNDVTAYVTNNDTGTTPAAASRIIRPNGYTSSVPPFYLQNERWAFTDDERNEIVQITRRKFKHLFKLSEETIVPSDQDFPTTNIISHEIYESSSSASSAAEHNSHGLNDISPRDQGTADVPSSATTTEGDYFTDNYENEGPDIDMDIDAVEDQGGVIDPYCEETTGQNSSKPIDINQKKLKILKDIENFHNLSQRQQFIKGANLFLEYIKYAFVEKIEENEITKFCFEMMVHYSKGQRSRESVDNDIKTITSIMEKMKYGINFNPFCQKRLEKKAALGLPKSVTKLALEFDDEEDLEVAEDYLIKEWSKLIDKSNSNIRCIEKFEQHIEKILKKLKLLTTVYFCEHCEKGTNYKCWYTESFKESEDIEAELLRRSRNDGESTASGDSTDEAADFGNPGTSSIEDLGETYEKSDFVPFICDCCQKENKNYQSSKKFQFLSPRIYYAAIFNNNQLSEEIQENYNKVHLQHDDIESSTLNQAGCTFFNSDFINRMKLIKKKIQLTNKLNLNSNHCFYEDSSDNGCIKDNNVDHTGNHDRTSHTEEIHLSTLIGLDGVRFNKKEALYPLILKTLEFPHHLTNDLTLTSLILPSVKKMNISDVTNGRGLFCSSELIDDEDDTTDEEDNVIDDGGKVYSNFDLFTGPLSDDLGLCSILGFEASYNNEMSNASNSTSVQIYLYQVGVIGDYPAVSKILGLIGQNGLNPCRSCSIFRSTKSETQGADSNSNGFDLNDVFKKEGGEIYKSYPVVNSLLNENIKSVETCVFTTPFIDKEANSHCKLNGQNELTGPTESTSIGYECCCYTLPIKDGAYYESAIKNIKKNPHLNKLYGISSLSHLMKSSSLVKNCQSSLAIVDCMHALLENITLHLVNLMFTDKVVPNYNDFEGSGFTVNLKNIHFPENGFPFCERINLIATKNQDATAAGSISTNGIYLKAEMILQIATMLPLIFLHQHNIRKSTLSTSGSNLATINISSMFLKVLVLLNRLVKICFTSHLSKEDIGIFHLNSIEFVLLYEQLFYRNEDLKKNHLMNIYVHELIHFGHYMREFGMLKSFNCFILERRMAMVTRANISRSNLLLSVSKKTCFETVLKSMELLTNGAAGDNDNIDVKEMISVVTAGTGTTFTSGVKRKLADSKSLASKTFDLKRRKLASSNSLNLNQNNQNNGHSHKMVALRKLLGIESKEFIPIKTFLKDEFNKNYSTHGQPFCETAASTTGGRRFNFEKDVLESESLNRYVKLDFNQIQGFEYYSESLKVSKPVSTSVNGSNLEKIYTSKAKAGSVCLISGYITNFCKENDRKSFNKVVYSGVCQKIVSVKLKTDDSNDIKIITLVKLADIKPIIIMQDDGSLIQRTEILPRLRSNQELGDDNHRSNNNFVSYCVKANDLSDSSTSKSTPKELICNLETDIVCTVGQFRLNNYKPKQYYYSNVLDDQIFTQPGNSELENETNSNAESNHNMDLLVLIQKETFFNFEKVLESRKIKEPEFQTLVKL